MESTLYDFLFWVLLGLLWWLYVDVYYKYRLDLYRQNLFEVRDTLFDAAAKHGLFENKAYTMTRITINGMIRFAHEVSFLRLLLGYFSHRWFVKRDIAGLYLRDYATALKELPEEQQRLVIRARVQSHMALASHVLHTSIVLLPLFHVTFGLLKAMRLASRVIKWFFESRQNKKPWAFVDAEAYCIGKPASTGGQAHENNLAF